MSVPVNEACGGINCDPGCCASHITSFQPPFPIQPIRKTPEIARIGSRNKNPHIYSRFARIREETTRPDANQSPGSRV
ncbi:MAG: hypothetical protein Q7V05_11195 [Methanoregula sp.]|nr:hypothetical protein [Methanoregula sp.]